MTPEVSCNSVDYVTHGHMILPAMVYDIYVVLYFTEIPGALGGPRVGEARQSSRGSGAIQRLAKR